MTKCLSPIHNKKPKKKPVGDEDDEDKAFKAKQMAGSYLFILRRITVWPSFADKKAREDMAKVAGKKGAMNTGQQGIKKSGKK